MSDVSVKCPVAYINMEDVLSQKLISSWAKHFPHRSLILAFSNLELSDFPIPFISEEQSTSLSTQSHFKEHQWKKEHSAWSYQSVFMFGHACVTPRFSQLKHDFWPDTLASFKPSITIIQAKFKVATILDFIKSMLDSPYRLVELSSPLSCHPLVSEMGSISTLSWIA